MVTSDSTSKKVVVIGGGTGTFTVLSGLRAYPLHLTAIVTMADDGGSTGRLRDEFGVLPPGDIRQCLVALSDAPLVLRKLFNHRFDKGELAGHSFGNIFISTLEQVTGSLDESLDVIANVLNIRGRVIPVTLSKVRLMTELRNGKVLEGESVLSNYQLLSRFGIKKSYLTPKPKANPKALRAIKEADVIIVGPGNLYGSLIPNFLVPGVSSAFLSSRATKIFVTNLMNKHGHTDDFVVGDYVRAVEDIIDKEDVFDAVLYNTTKPPSTLVKRYADEGAPVLLGEMKKDVPSRFVGEDLLAKKLGVSHKKDLLRRTLIRHDPKKLAKAIIKLMNE